MVDLDIKEYLAATDAVSKQPYGVTYQPTRFSKDLFIRCSSWNLSLPLLALSYGY